MRTRKLPHRFAAARLARRAAAQRQRDAQEQNYSCTNFFHVCVYLPSHGGMSVGLLSVF